MKTRSRTRLVAAMLALATAAVAQDRAGTIRGSVSDKDLKGPLPAVTVTVLETGQTASTTEQGNYSIPDVKPGRYTVVFAKDGYVKVVRNDVIVGVGQLTDLAVEMPGDIAQMDEFVVQDLQLDAGSEAGLLQLRLDSASLVDAISSDLMSRAGASDAAGALRLVAGATVQDGKSAVIRGLPDRYVSNKLNGVRLPSAEEEKRAVELDQFPSTVIQSIQVSKTFTPDQQGDASGGAVDVRLKGIPDEPFFLQFKSQIGRNTQVTGRSDFLTYKGGGVSFWGKDSGGRALQADRIGADWDGAVGTSRDLAPTDSKWSLSMGGRTEIGDGVRFGGFGGVFYERDSSFHDHGVDDSMWVTTPGAAMTPRQFQASGSDDFKTGLLDVTRGSESVRWGALGTVGLESELHALTLVYLLTQTAEDSATLAEDTRGKEFFFPGFDPNNQTTPGHSSPDAAPYLREETLQYTERSTQTVQLQGSHKLDMLAHEKPPELEWSVARSNAESIEPDKRQFGEKWVPGRTIGPFTIDPLHLPLKPAANINLGNLQRIFKSIQEVSDQYSTDLKVPLAGADETDGYLKFGLFHDRVRRRFNQDTFANFGDANAENGFAAPFDVPWSANWGSGHPILASDFDVDYHGRQEITAWYAMADVPVASALSLIGGARFESTTIDIVNVPEALATWLPIGSLSLTHLNPGDADVSFRQHDVLPAIALVARPDDQLTVRVSYAETVARQTFKELTPILQQEYLGGPIFVGNPDLKMSAVRNYDLRLDWVPEVGTLLSTSLFRKDITDAIEYVQRLGSDIDATTAVNDPKGRLEGLELEGRQQLGNFWESLDGFAVGANATIIHSEVTLTQAERDGFSQPGIEAPMNSRDMTNAPAHLYNAFVTWEQPDFGTRVGLFYTRQGDTLVAGAGEATGHFIPSVYATEFDTMNLSVTQSIGRGIELGFSAKNLTNPDISTVYRSPYVGSDVRRTSHRDGIDYALSIGGTIHF